MVYQETNSFNAFKQSQYLELISALNACSSYLNLEEGPYVVLEEEWHVLDCLFKKLDVHQDCDCFLGRKRDYHLKIL